MRKHLEGGALVASSTIGRQRLSCQFSCWCHGSLMVTDVPMCGTSIVCLDAATVVVKVERHRKLALVTGIGYRVEEQMCIGGRFVVK